jgi:hypothetical protein
MKTFLGIALALITLSAANAAQAGACGDRHARVVSFNELLVPDGAPRPADASAFSIVDDDMTVEKLFALVGPPDASDGTTTTIYVYCFGDGSEVRVGTRDGSTIEYVRRDGHEMYKRKKKK